MFQEYVARILKIQYLRILRIHGEISSTYAEAKVATVARSQRRLALIAHMGIEITVAELFFLPRRVCKGTGECSFLIE